jgi:Alpha/beta hydrolase of unknown function (DUF900)
MLKLVWTPGAAAAPDENTYKQAVDTLTARYADQSAVASFPRDAAAQIRGLDELAGVIKAWLGARTVPSAAPKLMLHGYDYDPRHVGDPAYDPFTLVYGYPGTGGPDARLSWLPLVEECDDRGSRRQETAIAFAWVSTGSLAEYAAAGWSESYQYACVDLAHLAAQALAAVLGILAAENVPVDVLAHSLGTRLFTQTVAALGRENGTLNSVILLDGAEYSVDAAATFAGRAFNVVNVTNEVDAVLADAGEQFGDPSRVPGSIVSCSLGRYGLGTQISWFGIATYPPNWVDISLDRRDVQAWFKAARRLYADGDRERQCASIRQPQSLGLLHRGRQPRVADRPAVEASVGRRGAGADRGPAEGRPEQQSTGVRRRRHPANHADDHGGADQIPAGRCLISSGSAIGNRAISVR